MRLEMTMSTKEDEDVFKNCIEEIIEEGFTLNTIRNNAQKVKSIIRIDENPEFQKGIGFFNSHAPQKTAIVIMSQNKRIVLIFPATKISGPKIQTTDWTNLDRQCGHPCSRFCDC